MDGSANKLTPDLQAWSLQMAPDASLSSSVVRCLAVMIALTLLPSIATLAEQLPLRKFTTADGLPSNSITCVKRDSRGFMWFCTPEGLSRFDGYTFVNYGADQGLPDRYVTDFVETRNGEYWVATLRGLAQFNPKPTAKHQMFALYRLGETEAVKRVYALLADEHGDIWVGTGGGVFQLTKVGERWISHRIEFPAGDGSEGPLMEDHLGNIWIVQGIVGGTIWRRKPSGALERIEDPFFVKNKITGLIEDRQGRIWASTYYGLALLASRLRPGQPAVSRVYGTRDGLLSNDACCMFQSSDGRLWVGAGGEYEIVSDPDGGNVRFQFVGRGESFSPISAEDTQGNLWMGATRIAKQGFVSYGRADGLAPADIRSVFDGYDGTLYVVTGEHSRFIHRFDGRRFTTVTPLIPGYDPSNEFFWGWGQIHFQDHTGEWWVGTMHGLVRFPKVAHVEDLARTRPLATYTSRNGLDGEAIWRLYEDSHGNVWISAWGGHSGLTLWERATGRFHVFTKAEGWDPGLCSAFREDRSGSVWIGRDDGLARFRDGRFVYFNADNGYPVSGALTMFVGHDGELWVGTSRRGLFRVPGPSADHPQFISYTTREGLSSNRVDAITEDHWTRIYFWTGRGVDRLEPATGAIRHYTEADGVVASGSDHNVAFTDRQGRLWFGAEGLSRLDLEPDVPSTIPPPIRITGLRIRGISYPLSELGETNLAGLVLDPDWNAIQIDFASLNFGVGEVLHYQYKLEGADEDWSPLTESRAVNYAKLRPGAYRFLVRTVNAEGITSPSSASLSFRLLAPVWQRWWFLSLAALVLALILYEAYRYRVAQLLRVERIRTRIASDLHDDVGAGLSQIAILSEVVKRDASRNGSETGKMLDHIADLSRDLVDSMSEIVWAISPRRDSFDSLVQRMRRFASDMLAARNIEFELRATSNDHHLNLSADVRRHVFLVFKEVVNNSARHSGCTRVNSALVIEKDALELTLSDNGCGFEDSVAISETDHGHGIENIRRRADEMGGRIEIASAKSAGTLINLSVPLARRRLSSLRTKMTT